MAVIIIPARYHSSRLPGKPCLALTGKPLIQHTYEAVQGGKRIDRIIVATDSEEIVGLVRAFGGEAILSLEKCRNGTERCADAAKQLGLSDNTTVVNVQCDEPYMMSALVDIAVRKHENNLRFVTTLMSKVGYDWRSNLHVVKVVCTPDHKALYFSRSDIPNGGAWWWLHHGVYLYSVQLLRLYASWEPARLEQVEQLEQLRWLEAGYDVHCEAVPYYGIKIDTRADYDAFVVKEKSCGNI